MNISKQEIYDLRPEMLKEMQFDNDIIFNDDLFIMFYYPINKNETDRSNPYFINYGYCINYQWADEEKSRINMRYLSLTGLPPIPKILNLTIANIIVGNYLSPEREIWFKKFKDMLSIDDNVQYTDIMI